MSRTFEEKPDTWTDWTPGAIHEVPGSDGQVFYAIVGDGIRVGEKASNLWIIHWHTPTPPLEPRWQISGCGLHTVQSVEPLHVEPSLACEDGCPSHGWIRAGVWSNA